MRPLPLQGEAEKLLARVWADDYGRIALPVDPVWIARQLGMEVYVSALDPDVSALIYAAPGSQTSIYLNKDEPRVRQRFSCSHEIGHYVRRTASGAASFGFVDHRDHISSLGLDPEERWANQFAAALLMPADLVRASPQRDPVDLARTFAVSRRAMEIRLDDVRPAA